jgi:hypothetical protein
MQASERRKLFKIAVFIAPFPNGSAQAQKIITDGLENRTSLSKWKQFPCSR